MQAAHHPENADAIAAGLIPIGSTFVQDAKSLLAGFNAIMDIMNEIRGMFPPSTPTHPMAPAN
jgi:hypothetical protein